MSNPPDPIERFIELYDAAKKLDPAVMPEPAAATLATVGEAARPSSRVVLLKGVDARGFTFYTNLESRKARELASNPRAALCFYWPTLDVQVRVEGEATQVADAEADEYFSTRPRGSQLGALASKQSRAIERPGVLEERFERYESVYAGREIPRPAFWSGFRIRPDMIEFWYNRPNRLHDRVLYERDGEGWRVTTLYP